MVQRLKLIVLALVLIVTGCGSKDKPNGLITKLKDGNYLAKMAVGDYGSYPMAKMKVEDGKVSSFRYMEILVNTGEEKNQDNFNYPDGLKTIKNLNEQFNEKKDLEEVDFDAVSGATHTKESFKELVEELLIKASEGETYKPVYNDGEYKVKAELATHGWLPEVIIIVRDGQIVGIDYFELAIDDIKSNKVVFDEDKKPIIKDDGKPRTEPVQVKTGDRKSVENYGNLDFFDVIKGLQKLIIDNNGTKNLNLDGTTGATKTRTAMINLVDKALEDAK